MRSSRVSTQLRLFLLVCTGTTAVLSLVSLPVSAQPHESAWNIERVGTSVTATGAADRGAFSKLSPWPQTDGRYIYSGCYARSPLTIADDPAASRCFTIVDAADPLAPKRITSVHTYDPVNSPSPPLDHVVWSRDYPHSNLPVRVPCRVNWADPDIASGRTAPGCWDPGWNTHSHYVQKGSGEFLAINQERFRDGTTRQAGYHGVKFYDIADRAKPRFLSYWEAPVSPPDAETGINGDARGVHHFNFSGDYLYVGSEYEGYIGKILVILDVSDPANPREAGKWWLPGQKTPEEDAIRDWVQQPSFSNPIKPAGGGKLTRHVGMHYVTVDDDVAYLSYHQAGLVILDVSDKANPKLLSRLRYLDPGFDATNPDIDACRAAAGTDNAACGNTHAAKPVPGTNLLMVSDEYFTCPYGHVRIVDIANPSAPRIVSHYMTPENAACDPSEPLRAANAARFPRRGPSSHLGNPMGTDLYFMAWYGNGLQVIDISDPSNPVSAGHYNYRIDRELGRDEAQYAGSDTYDVTFGPNDHLYLSDGTSGLRVLRYTGPIAGGQ
jgi:hypothetical protein